MSYKKPEAVVEKRGDSSKPKELSSDIKKCNSCGKMGHLSATCWKNKKPINVIEESKEQSSTESVDSKEESSVYDDGSSVEDNVVLNIDFDISEIDYTTHLPQEWRAGQKVTNISEARLIRSCQLATNSELITNLN